MPEVTIWFIQRHQPQNYHFNTILEVHFFRKFYKFDIASRFVYSVKWVNRTWVNRTRKSWLHKRLPLSTYAWMYWAKTLNEKTGNCTLILYKTNGQRAVLNAYYAPFPLSTWDAYSLWSCRQFGGRSQCCLFCFFVYQQNHPYNAVIKPKQLIITSKARDQLHPANNRTFSERFLNVLKGFLNVKKKKKTFFKRFFVIGSGRLKSVLLDV